MSKNLPQFPNTAAIIVEKITLVCAWKEKTTAKNTLPKIARSPGRQSQFAPYYRYRYTHHDGKAKWHKSFSKKHRIYQTLEMVFNHPSSSKNNTGVTTNNHYATLPGLQPVHDGDSHKKAISTKTVQFVTTNNASNYSCSRPHQWFFHFSEKHEVSSLEFNGFTGRLAQAPNQSLSHFSQ